GRRSSPHSLPELGEALDRDRHRRLQLLREERHAQLLEQPAELLELRAHGAALRARAELAAIGLLERRKLAREARIALRIGAQLLKAQRGGLEVAREVLQPLPRRAREPAGGEEPRELRADVGRGLRKAFLEGRKALLQRRAFGLDHGRRARDLLR